MKGVMDVVKLGPLRVGLDVVVVSRVKQMYEKRPRQFVQRLFSKDEATYCLAAARPCRRYQRFAGRIAAKEAVMKVLGKGWPHVPWTDIEIDRDGSGQPIAKLRGKALELMERHKLAHIQVSITHDGEIAVAVAVGIPKT
jgi:holo-[acyl-carrier protein] synthase